MDKEYWEISIAELPDKLLEQISGLLHRYSTGLIRLYTDHWDELEYSPIGAGTFVSIDGMHGILTAHHVVETLESEDRLGFTLQEQEQHFSIPVEQLTIIEIATPEKESLGPDLAFIRIPDAHLGTIKAYRTFFNLSVEREDSLKIDIDKKKLCFVCGIIGNRTTEEEPGAGFEQVIGVHGYCGASGIEESYSVGDYDYLDIGIEYKPDDDIPKSFGGMSGGGIWLVSLAKDDAGKITMKDHKYCGVIFYQTERKDNSRLLRGHGPKSVYGLVYDAIKDQMLD